jgi:hypothetical protein
MFEMPVSGLYAEESQRRVRHWHPLAVVAVAAEAEPGHAKSQTR